MASTAAILSLLIFLEMALMLLTAVYVKNIVNGSAEHMQARDEKMIDVENTQQDYPTVTEAVRSEIQEFNEGIKRISEALMTSQTRFKQLMDEEINRETMKIIYGTAT